MAHRQCFDSYLSFFFKKGVRHDSDVQLSVLGERIADIHLRAAHIPVRA